MDEELEIWRRELLAETAERVASEHRYAGTVRVERKATIEEWKKQRRWPELRAEKERCIEVDRQEHVRYKEINTINGRDFDWIDHGAIEEIMLRPEKPLHIRCRNCKNSMNVPFDVFPKNPPFYYFDIDCLHCSNCHPFSIDSVEGKRIERWLQLSRREAAEWHYLDLAIEGLEEDGWRYGADIVQPKGTINLRRRRSLSLAVRFKVLKRDGFRCTYCGAAAAKGEALHIDHIVSVADGGSDDLDNLCAACVPCNQGKGSISVHHEPATDS